jgi:hypothetical protein
MSLQAHTNRVGAFQKRETKTWRYRDLVTNQTQTQSFSIPVAESFKSAVVRSNGRDPTDYNRSVYKLLKQVPYSYTDITRNDSGQIESGASVTQPYPGEGFQLGVDFYNIDDIISNAKAAANVKALNKLGGDKQQLFVDLLEGRKTFGMLLSTSMTMLNALKQLKRGNIGGAISAIGGSRRDILTGKSAANGYLQYRYGWKPLVDSIYGYQEALKRDWAAQMQLPTAKGFQSISFEKHDSFDYGAEATHQCYGGVKTTYNASISREGLADFERNILGAYNPLSVGWELIPYSFVIDWFIPVGDVLEAYSATAGLSDVKGFTSLWLDYTHHYRGQTEGSSSLTVVQRGEFQQAHYHFERSTHEAIRPQFYGEPSPFGGVKKSRGLAAAALIRQLMR